MWQLYQFPLCPFSRKVRLQLEEKGIGYELVRESPWTRRDEFLDLNPSGQTPVMVDAAIGVTLIDSKAIAEYIEETVDRTAMIPGNAAARAEVRRLVAYFDEKFYADVVGPLLNERAIKRIVHRASPDAGALRNAMKAANDHLDYIDYLVASRRWMAGPLISLADMACAAHLSVADYLGGIDWRGHDETRQWYSGMKSRKSLRVVLADRMELVSPPEHYEKPDF
jgi:glutathione S-transferase